jgi:hypothetical protein
MPSINNFLSGFSNGLPGMKDFQHASRLYTDDNFKLAPKNKFLFHVVFDIDNTVPARAFTTNERLELNMLVKSCELPKYDMNLEEKLQYNKKIYVGTRIKYSPVTITFHDDNADTVNAFWKSYYEYNISDSLSVANAGGVNTTKDNAYELLQASTQFGMDNAQKRRQPFLKNITIFALHKKRFTSFTLVNPVIGSFSHDNLDQADGGGIMSNTMQIFYETVLYGVGLVKPSVAGGGRGVPGFATVHYDLEPSPLSVLGRGTTSIFGPGGIVDGIGSVISDVQNDNFSVGTILTAVNTYNNARKIKAKEAVKEELKGIVKEGVIEIGKQAGTITNPVGNFSVGNAAVAAVAVGATLASAKGLIDNRKDKNNTVISNPVIDTRNYLSPTESFNLLENNLSARNQVAAGIYYKLIGSRKGLNIAQSDVEYTAASESTKNIYRSRALTDITKLVNEGYIKINRVTNEVSIVAERARL